jgi:hypothetical protein
MNFPKILLTSYGGYMIGSEMTKRLALEARFLPLSLPLFSTIYFSLGKSMNFQDGSTRREKRSLRGSWA